MASIEFDSRPFIAGLDSAIKDLERDGERAIADTGAAAADRAGELAPVVTGELRASKQVVEGHDDRGYFVEVRFTADHALANEFGTSTMPARPFLRPALAEAAAEFARRQP